MRITFSLLLIGLAFTQCKNKFDREIISHLQGEWTLIYDNKSYDNKVTGEIEPFFKQNNLYHFTQDTIYNSNHYGYYNATSKKNKYLSYKTKYIVKHSIIILYS